MSEHPLLALDPALGCRGWQSPLPHRKNLLCRVVCLAYQYLSVPSTRRVSSGSRRKQRSSSSRARDAHP